VTKLLPIAAKTKNKSSRVNGVWFIFKAPFLSSLEYRLIVYYKVGLVLSISVNTQFFVNVHA